jgi:hypothetical protein
MVTGTGLAVDNKPFPHRAHTLIDALFELGPDAALLVEHAFALGDDHLEARVVGVQCLVEGALHPPDLVGGDGANPFHPHATHGRLDRLPVDTLLPAAGDQVLGFDEGRDVLAAGSRGITVIDDTYNANPRSMEEAIKTLSELRADNRGVLVAGDMLELGEHSAKMHEKTGSLCAESGISRLYVTGQFAGNTADGAAGNGMNLNSIVTGSHDDILEDITRWLGAGDWVLVKGSRGMRMEKIVFKLKQWAGE